ncbi:hypothetical protein [Aliterella atlantica]|nr:hypothetical protein [Aliterella atlantica]
MAAIYTISCPRQFALVQGFPVAGLVSPLVMDGDRLKANYNLLSLS